MNYLKLLPLFTIFLLGCASKRKWPSPAKWGYQLQGYEEAFKTDRIKNSKNMLWVIDYSKDGSQERAFSKNDVSKLKKNGNTVLSYISIGEAEDYRYYFKEMPKNILVEENKNWVGNFKIRYWEKSWKDILLSENGYFARLIGAGFDGAYLDIVDGFHNFKDKKKSAQEMAQLIKEIAAFTRSRNPNFLLVMQNGADIIDYIVDKNDLLKNVDALAIEGYFFIEGKFTEDKWLMKLIDEYQNYKVPILSIEYINKESDLKKYAGLVKRKGLLPLAGHRPLKGKLIFADEILGELYP